MLDLALEFLNCVVKFASKLLGVPVESVHLANDTLEVLAVGRRFEQDDQGSCHRIRRHRSGWAENIQEAGYQELQQLVGDVQGLIRDLRKPSAWRIKNGNLNLVQCSATAMRSGPPNVTKISILRAQPGIL